MFNIGDIVRVKLGATDRETDYNPTLIGQKFTVQKIDGKYVLLQERRWWVDISCLEPIKNLTKEERILYIIAVIYKRFEERKNNVESAQSPYLS